MVHMCAMACVDPWWMPPSESTAAFYGAYYRKLCTCRNRTLWWPQISRLHRILLSVRRAT